MTNRSALIIFAKSPNQALVKTRLAPHLSDSGRVGLYTGLLEGTVRRLAGIEGVDTFICYWPEEEGGYFARFGLRMFPQSRGGMGTRMHKALKRVLDLGYEKAALVGVDIPELSGPLVLRALELLSVCDVVFGPARDGGYYLVGLREPRAEIFQGIEWSTCHTLGQSVEKASELGLRTGLTEVLSDIDTFEDLKSSGLLPGSPGTGAAGND
jgi:rSAM/selenodomain-associated transferase 1